MFQVLYAPVSPAEESKNMILYLGLGFFAIGLVITFVGLGEKGYKTVELKMVGPFVAGVGVALVCVRILLCSLASLNNGREQNCELEQLLGDDRQEGFGLEIKDEHI